MRASGIGLLVAAVSLLAGCGEGEETSTQAEGPAEPIAYKVFVGYPPVARSIEIDEHGKATTSVQYRDEERPHRSRFTVPEEQLNEIRAHLAASDLGELPDEQLTDHVYATITYGDEEGTGGTAETPEENEDTPEDLRIAIEMLTDLMPPLEKSGDQDQP
ncbi:MAG: hypothetical protein KDB58_06990 [Solirubrobacterales bacterium]|nr:hypothetical protein [Solirubrobacterales bacterium]MCB8969763.1 hypothetical protein [Thermoleophilales bacterium]MCO5327142.1 hypothetical protein [Solirubrobacterales bacterium]